MKRILVGVDGSPAATAAALFAAELAHDTGAELIVASALEPPMLFSPDATGQVVEQQLIAARSAAAAALADASALLSHDGVHMKTVTLEGPAADALAELAKQSEVDLVVVGHRSRSAIARVLLGSVADRLVEICSRPVLVHR